MSLLSSEYRAELSALLSRKAAAPVHLSKGFSSPGRLILESQVPNLRLGGQIVSRDLSEAAYTPMRIVGGKVMMPFDEGKLQSLFGRSPMRFSTIKIGDHPDFASLKHDQTTHHYCASMFVDIVGSTKLIAKGYSLSEIRKIKDTVLTLAIHTANFFGGHIHRLQGDAIFLQFVRTDYHENDAILGALNTAAVLCYFVTQDLNEIFQADGSAPLAIRIGLDFGPANKVLWSHYGIPGCSELTTTSLHTDLAAKLQSQAADNEVRIGANIRETEQLPYNFWDFPNRTISYIFPETSYQQYVFNWRKYLCSFNFARLHADGQKIIIDDSTAGLSILANRNNGVNILLLHPNSATVKKGETLVFRLNRAGVAYPKQANETANWQLHYYPTNNATPILIASKSDYGTFPTFSVAFQGQRGHYIAQCVIMNVSTFTTRTTRFPFFAR